MQKFLKITNWKPAKLCVFAGKINYTQYGFFDKHLIRFIMWIGKGPTDLKGEFEFTLEGETKVYHSGDIVHIPSNSTHTGKAITPCSLMDVFSPVREEYK